jgi:phospholipid/cholesterol/gamma-HCH transport system substrate-binding protein
MKSQDQAKRLRIGLLGIVMTIAIVLVAQSFDKMPLITGGNDYSAYLADTAGLQPGSKVVVAGVTVGAVQDIAIDGDKVLMHFSAKGVTVTDDSYLAVKTQTVLGTKLVELSPGRGPRIPAGTSIPVEHTTVPYSLTDALGDLTNTASGLDTEQVTNSLEVLSETFDHTEPQLGAAMQGVSRFSETVASRDQMVQELLGNAEQVTKVLSDRSEQINKLLLDGNTLFAAVDARRRALDTLLANVTAVTAQVQGLIADNADLAPTLEKLNQVTDLLNQRREDIKAIFHPLALYGTSLGESVSAGPFFKAYVSNLLPGQFLQPFIDAAFKDKGVDPSKVPGFGAPWPVTCGHNTPPGTVPPGSTMPLPDPSTCPVQPEEVPGGRPTGDAASTPTPQPAPAPAAPLLPGLPAIPGIPAIPGLGG